jgi:Dolichyl-phosphate-mannose-protein mannosyltransferase
VSWLTALRKHRAAAFALSAVALLLLVTQASSPMPAVHGDGYYTYLWARTLVVDHDADFANDYAICGDPGGFADLPVGKNVNLWNMGPALFWVPILAVDRQLSAAKDDPDPQVAAACHGPLAERAVRGSTLAGILTILLGYLTARRRFGEWPAIFGASVIGLATLMTYYTTLMLSYGHAASAFACALFVWLWDGSRERRSALGWALLGGALGLAMLMRSQNVVLAVLALFEWCVMARRLAGDAREPVAAPRDPVRRLAVRRDPLRRLAVHVGVGVIFVLAAIAVFSPQMFYCKKVSGHWFTVLQSEGYMRWSTPNILRVLFSAGNGLYPWNPILYPATLGLFLLLLRARTRALGFALLVLFALDTYVVSCVWDWWGSIGYPGRRFDLMMAPMMVGLAASARGFAALHRRRRRFTLSLVTACTLFVAGYATWAVQYGLARSMRTDLARESHESWTESFGYGARTLWSAVGNPFTWPASLPFAMKWHVHPRRWDVLGGPELFYHQERTLERRAGGSTVWFDNAEHADYLDGGWRTSVEMLEGMRVRIAEPGRGRILLPLHYPDAGALAFRVALAKPPSASGAAVTLGLEVNGTLIPAQTIAPGGISELRFELPPGVTHHGINEVFVVLGGDDVGFERMEILDRTPTPEELQRARDEVRRRERPR